MILDSIFLKKVLAAAGEIIDILESRNAELYESHSQGAGGDISIGADLICEAIFYNNLKDLYNVDSEESGFMPSDITSDFCVFMDPLDGSDNFMSNIPYYGASLALCSKDEVLEAIVVNFVSKDISYLSQNLLHQNHNEPLIFNLKSIKNLNEISITSRFKNLKHKSGIYEKAHNSEEITSLFMQNKVKFRSLGALALSLGFSSHYKFVFFHGNIRKYDAIAGLFLSQNSCIFGHVDFYKANLRFKNLFKKYYNTATILDRSIQSNWLLIANKELATQIFGV